MIKFDFEKFGTEKRYSRNMLADLVGIPYKTVCLMWDRGSLKMETLNKIEKKLGELSKFVVNKKAQQIY